MGTFDSVYLNKIRQLEEENKRLKRILSEEEAKYHGPSDRPLSEMTPEEAFHYGSKRANDFLKYSDSGDGFLPGKGGYKHPTRDEFDHPHFNKGFYSVVKAHVERTRQEDARYQAMRDEEDDRVGGPDRTANF